METNLVGLSGPIMISIDVTYRFDAILGASTVSMEVALLY